MDRDTIVLLIPVLALAIGFAAILKLPRRLFGHRSDPQLEECVEALEQELSTLRQELTAAQERLDFAERRLARADEARQPDKGH